VRRWSNGLAALILLIMIAIGAANLIRVERSTGDGVSTVAGSAFEADQPEGPLTLEAAYVTAGVRAREWNADAELTFASLQADWPLDPQEPGPAEIPPGGWVRFAFVDGARSHLLSVVIERYSGEIVMAESKPWDGRRNGSLSVAQMGITSETAVVIAESSYGQAYRIQCPIKRHETDVTLLAGQPVATPVDISTPIVSSGTPPVVGTTVAVHTAETADSAITPRWLVTYRDGTQPGVNSVEMEIDAMTGQILFIDDRSQGCSDLTE